MAKKDIARREKKKPRKDGAKAATISPINPNAPLEVIPKRKAAKEPKE